MTLYNFQGAPDIPIDNLNEDLFEVNDYISTLSHFILKSATPITIALQGGWGTGKTSFIKLIDKELKPMKRLGVKEDGGTTLKETNNVITIHFNTWQYTQFNLEENLGISFLNYMIRKMSEGLEGTVSEHVKEAMNALNNILKATAVNMAAQKGIVLPVNDQERAYTDPAQSIETLKNSLEQIIEQHLTTIGKSNENTRLVIFIDDLDRLDPEVAVSLLEVIKLFLDIKGCIFVLAVDNRVIEEGIKSSKSTSGNKTKSFLDKIIQVPFKIPVETYNYKKFLDKNLLGIYDAESKAAETLNQLIRFSVGSNPRAFKRLINNFYLNYTIISKQDDMNTFDKPLLISTICMQLSFQPLYIAMLNMGEEEVFNTVLMIYEEEDFDSDIDFLRKAIENISHQDIFDEDVASNIDRYEHFLYLLQQVLKMIKEERGGGENLNIDDNEMRQFFSFLKQSQLTSGDGEVNKTIHEAKDYHIIDIKTYIDDSKSYKLAPRPVNFTYREETRNDMKTKAGFRYILNTLANDKESIDKLKDVDELGKYVKGLILAPMSQDKTKEYKNDYSIVPVGNEEIGIAEFGYHFSGDASVKHLYNILKYLEANRNSISPKSYEIKLGVYKV